MSLEPVPATTAVDGTARRLRHGLYLIAMLTEGGALLELALLRHWKTPVQVIPWIVLGTLLIATAVAWWGPPRFRAGVRVVSYLAVPAAAFGVWEHIEANHNAGPLDFRYAAKWTTMSAWSQWWTAATKGVGPSPPLTPALLALVALMILIATAAPKRTTTESVDRD